MLMLLGHDLRPARPPISPHSKHSNVEIGDLKQPDTVVKANWYFPSFITFPQSNHAQNELFYSALDFGVLRARVYPASILVTGTILR